MKADLATSIAAAIAGVVISFLICNLLFAGAIEEKTVKTVDGNVSVDLADPDAEVFNYKALNPTVEVYVGNCTEVNMYGECVDESSAQIEEGIIEESTEENTQENSGTNSNSSSNNSNNSSNSTNNSNQQRNG